MDREQFEVFNKQLCLRRNSAHKEILLIGDSHAGHLYQGLNYLYGEDADVLQATATGCKPLLRDARGETTCSQMIKFVFQTYLLQNKVDLLVISARWGKEDLDGIRKTLEWLKGRNISTILIGPTPEYDLRLPSLLAQTPGLRDYGAVQSHVLPEFAQLDEDISGVVDPNTGIRYFSAFKALCPKAECDVLAGDVPVYYDTGHLTKSGSIMLVERFGPLLRH
jgi:hypothetical protein